MLLLFQLLQLTNQTSWPKKLANIMVHLLMVRFWFLAW